MSPRARLAAAALAAAVAGLVGVAPAGAAGPPAGVPSAPTAAQAWVGRVLAPVVARTAPRRSAKARTVVQPIAPLGGGGTTLLITRSLLVGETRWVEVLLPIRPNGARGWIPADVLDLRRTPMRIRIDVSERRLTLLRAGRVVARMPVAVGKAGTPTPRGNRFAVAELIRTNDPGGFLGPTVLPLTGYSETLNEFAGGNGRVAIHGTSLPGLIGGAVSNGCIRMFNADIQRLARAARPGTPVSITP